MVGSAQIVWAAERKVKWRPCLRASKDLYGSHETIDDEVDGVDVEQGEVPLTLLRSPNLAVYQVSGAEVESSNL